MKRLFMIMSAVLTFWSMALISYATAKVYNADTLNIHLVSLYGTTTGILTVVTGYIQRRAGMFLNATENSTRPSK